MTSCGRAVSCMGARIRTLAVPSTSKSDVPETKVRTQRNNEEAS
jgi:hypothetical protein